MDASIPCPDCGRIGRFPAESSGRKFRCPGCGVVFSAPKPESSEPYAPPQTRIGPSAPKGAIPSLGDGWHFHVQVKRDPARRLKGVLKAEVTPRGLVLRKPKGDEEVTRLPIGTPARLVSGQTFAVEREGREITLVVAQRGVYGYRLAGDLVEFLERTRGFPREPEYTVPRSLVMAAYAPLLIAFVGMSGGAIGGAIGGGVGGGLLTANLAILRKESWSVTARIWACIGVTLGGVTAFGTLVVVVVLLARSGNSTAPAPPNRPSAPSDNRPFAEPRPPSFGPGPGISVEPVGGATPSPFVEPRTPPPATDFDELIGYWPLDEDSGTTAGDSSGQGHNATLTSARWVDGIRGRAVRFDGHGFLDYGDSPDFNFARGESFTIAGWFQSAEWEGPLVSQRLAKDGAPVIDIVLEARTVTATVRPNGRETLDFPKLVGKPIQDNAWHHFALVRRGLDSLELYLDGTIHGQSTGKDVGGPITTDLRVVGSERYWVKTQWAAPHFLQGAVDEFCVFHRDLRADEIRRLAGR